MIISPYNYYEINLKGKTKEEILKEIKSLNKWYIIFYSGIKNGKHN